MNSQANQNKGKIIGLSDKAIYIIGQNRFQSDLLSFYLESNTDAGGVEAFKPAAPIKKQINKQDLVLLECKGPDAGKFIKRLQPDKQELITGCLVAFYNVSPGCGIEETAVEMGVKGIFYDQDPLDRFRKGISAIFDGELWVSREILTKYVLKERKRQKPGNKEKKLLTQRELEILAMISAGITNEDIACRLNISPNTVKTHIYNIFKKIDVPNRLQASLWAAKNL